MNPSGKFFILLLNFQKYKIQQPVHIYIYAFIYVGYTEKQYIEKQDALFAVLCSLREMERVTAMNPNEGTKK